MEKSPVAVRDERAARRAGPASAAGLQGLVALPQQVPPRPEEPGVLRALGGQLLHLGRHGRRRLQDLRQRAGSLEGRQRGWGSPAPGTVPEGSPEPARGQRAALTSPICISTSSSRSLVSPAGSSAGLDPSLPPRTLRGSAPGDPRGTAAGGSGPASAMSRSALPRRARLLPSSARGTPSPAPAERRPGRGWLAAAAVTAPEGSSGSCSPAPDGAGRIRPAAGRAGAAGLRPEGCVQGGRGKRRVPGGRCDAALPLPVRWPR